MLNTAQTTMLHALEDAGYDPYLSYIIAREYSAVYTLEEIRNMQQVCTTGLLATCLHFGFIWTTTHRSSNFWYGLWEAASDEHRNLLTIDGYKLESNLRY